MALAAFLGVEPPAEETPGERGCGCSSCGGLEFKDVTCSSTEKGTDPSMCGHNTVHMPMACRCHEKGLSDAVCVCD